MSCAACSASCIFCVNRSMRMLQDNEHDRVGNRPLGNARVPRADASPARTLGVSPKHSFSSPGKARTFQMPERKKFAIRECLGNRQLATGRVRPIGGHAGACVTQTCAILLLVHCSRASSRLSVLAMSAREKWIGHKALALLRPG